jgi:hypothetical protein
VAVICSGVKSILDVPATLEYLETAGVPVVGFRTRRFPGFYLTDSGQTVDWSVEDEEEAARLVLALAELGRSGLVIANPLAEGDQLDPETHDRALRAGLDEMERQGVRGKDVTPFSWTVSRGDGGREPAGQQEDHRGQRPARRPRGRLARRALLNVADPRVLVVGDLIYDMLAKAEGDITLGTDTFVPIRVAAGGSGANAAAWLARSGVETRFVGRVGDDVFGRFLEGEMERSGVKSCLARDPSLETGKVFVLVDGAGERTMITDRGAGEALGPDDLPEALFAGGHLHLSGYTFSGGSRRETALKALRLARGPA